jgi:hypothetical protein
MDTELLTEGYERAQEAAQIITSGISQYHFRSGIISLILCVCSNLTEHRTHEFPIQQRCRTLPNTTFHYHMKRTLTNDTTAFSWKLASYNWRKFRFATHRHTVVLLTSCGGCCLSSAGWGLGPALGWCVRSACVQTNKQTNKQKINNQLSGAYLET